MTPFSPASRLFPGRLQRALALLLTLALLIVLLWPGRAGGQAAGDRLTTRPRPPAPAVKALRVGEEIETRAGQRRLVRLPDGSVLYVNAGTRATLEAARRLKLAAGEVYLEAASLEKG